jgi:hypothetical protein
MPLRMAQGFALIPVSGRTENAPEATESATTESAAARAVRRAPGARKAGARKQPATKKHAAKKSAAKKSATKSAPKKAAKPREHKLPVPRRRQVQDDWCWAACVDMVLHYYRRSAVKQCDIVGRRLNRDECCDDPENEEFSVSCAPAAVRDVWLEWDIESAAHFPRGKRLGWISEAALKRELDAGRPVEIGLSWADGEGGHAIVVSGWREASGGVTYFYVNDPWNWGGELRKKYFEGGVGQVPYAELRAAYGMGCWKWTWTRIGPRGAATGGSPKGSAKDGPRG